ncbi:PAS domain-containing protein [Spirosoma pulveris]
MAKKLTLSTHPGWALLRLALQTNHRQELADNQTAQEQARSQLAKRHQREMAQISIVLDPLGWAKAIGRYRAQQTEQLSRYQAQRASILRRQEEELVELAQWSHQQQQQATDRIVFDQFCTLFNWSLTTPQQQGYDQALKQGDALILTDANQRILWTSQRFTSLTGYQPDEVVGQRPSLLQGSATDAGVVSYVRQQLSAAQGVEAELVNYHKSGATYVCHMRIEPLYNRLGELTHYAAVEHAVETGGNERREAVAPVYP